MYLAVTDKKIEIRQKEIKVLNNKIIADFRKLPFWKRWMIGEDDIKLQIINNWREFGFWTTRRIHQKQLEDVERFKKTNLIK